MNDRVRDRVSRIFPYPCDQVFDLAADIERYPEFIEGCLSAVVTHRNGNTCRVDQEIGFRLFHWRFESTAVLDRPSRIDISTYDKPFKSLELSWLLTPSGAGGCDAALESRIEFESSFLDALLGPLIPDGVARMVDVFAARARALYAGDGHAHG